MVFSLVVLLMFFIISFSLVGAVCLGFFLGNRKANHRYNVTLNLNTFDDVEIPEDGDGERVQPMVQPGKVIPLTKK